MMCRNCGWGGPKKDFIWRWCDDCAVAFVKGVASAFGAGLAAAVVKAVF